MLGASSLNNPAFYSDKEGKSLHTAESTFIYHFLAFCICSGTFASAFSQIYSRLLFNRIKTYASTNIATKFVGRTPILGASGISFSLMAMHLGKMCDPNYIKQQISDKQKQHEENILCVCLSFIFWNLPKPFIYLKRLDVSGGGSLAVRSGGAIFGFLYAKYGNTLWENSKKIFYEHDQRLQNAIQQNVL